MSPQELQSLKNKFGIIGDAPRLNRAITVAAQVASTELSVLILGESGVGKEVFSKIIHQLSPRKHNKFIAVNCGAIPEGTIDSELFGHEKGSFTGAMENRKGYFEEVDGGTIFLDEVGELPTGTQARLLRVLETGEYLRVGSSKVQKTNVRVIAATNVNLMGAIEKGKFREDLYYRLNTVPIEIPPLRERPDDIPLLFRKFSVDFSEKYGINPVRLDEAAQDILKRYAWPGNIRQLRNIAEQINVLEKSRFVQGEELLKFLPDHAPRQMPVIFDQNNPADLSEREILYKLLFEMKRDISELKKVVGVFGNNPSPVEVPSNDISVLGNINPVENNWGGTNNPTIILPDASNSIPNNARKEEFYEDVEENLSLMEVEKRMIERSLNKHRGRRKNAALELGISERTLYRKIKEYGLED
jgi:transcriptional regulator with PAS, ATPase and Fis domain